MATLPGEKTEDLAMLKIEDDQIKLSVPSQEEQPAPAVAEPEIDPTPQGVVEPKIQPEAQDQDILATLDGMTGKEGEQEPDVFSSLDALADPDEDAPAPEEEPGIAGKIGQRLMGTDVEDPLVLPRTVSTISGAIAGGVAGAALGSKVPPLPPPMGFFINPITGALVFSAAGAFGGAVAPEMAIEFAETLGLVEEGTRDEVGLSAEDLMTVAEGEFLLDVATGGGFTILRMGARPLVRAVTGITKAGTQAAEEAAAKGIHLMPVQVGNNIVPRGYVAVFGRFPFLGSAVRKNAMASERAVTEQIKGLASRVGVIKGMDDISERIFRDASTLVKSVEKRMSADYTKLFKLADEAGVVIEPKSTIKKGKALIEKINAGLTSLATKEGGISKGKAGEGLQIVKDFIEKEILPLQGQLPTKTEFKGAPVFGFQNVPGKSFNTRQTFEQMNGLFGKIDQTLASMEPAQRKFALAMMTQIRQAAKLDALSNAKGKSAGAIMKQVRELDREYSTTMASLFETATAKKFATVTKRGLRGVGVDRVTRTGTDQLSKLVLKTDSPKAIEELALLTQNNPGTMKQIAATILQQGVDDAPLIVGEDGVARFSTDAFIRRFGLENVKSPRYKTMKKLLEKSGSNVGMEDLQAIAAAGKIIETFDIPSVSSFIARRAGIGGIRAGISGLTPGLSIIGAGSVAGAFNTPALVLGMLMFVGARQFSKAIADPKTARLLKSVLKEEARSIDGRKRFIQVLRTVAATVQAPPSKTSVNIQGSQQDVEVDSGPLTGKAKEIMDKSIDFFIEQLDKIDEQNNQG